MRVLHFVRGFSVLSETFIYAYITELERQGVDNRVVTFNRLNEERRPFPKVKTIDKPGRWHPRRLWHRALVPLGIGTARTSSWPQMRSRLLKSIRQIQPDVVHAHFVHNAVLIAPVAQELSIPLVVTGYGFDVSKLPRDEFWHSRYDDLWPQITAATVLSDEMKGVVKDLGCSEEKLEVVHLSRDLSDFPYQSPSEDVETILFVGRFVHKKAPLDAIQAVEEANRRGTEIKLEMMGGGGLLEEARAYIEENELSGVVTLHGQVPNSEVARKMKTSNVFILPSKTTSAGDQEGTPTVLVEAQASGLPCVSTRHAGIPEMIPKKNRDLLAPEGDVEALANIIEDLSARTVSERIGIAERGRTKVEEEFSLTRETEKLRFIYERVIEGSTEGQMVN